MGTRPSPWRPSYWACLLSYRFDFVINVAEFVAARGEKLVAKTVDHHLEGCPLDRRDDAAVADLVIRCAPRVGMHHVAHLLRIGQLAVDARDHAPATGSIGDLKPLIGHYVADLEGLANDQ